MGKYIFINGLQILDHYKITLMSLKWVGDKLMWMMNKHSNLLVIFMLTNCTSVLQPIDMTLQCPNTHSRWHSIVES
jgi:hypothetical protein